MLKMRVVSSWNDYQNSTMKYPLFKPSSALFLTYLLICCSFNGCSSISIQPYVANTKSIKILAAKRFLKGADYERLSYAEGEVQRECGEVKETLAPLSSDKIELSDLQMIELDKITDRIVANNYGSILPKSLKQIREEGLSGKGYLTLEISTNVTTHKISADLATINDKENFQPLREIYQLLRNAKCYHDLCGYPSFYGLGRGSLDSGLGCKVTRQ